LRRRGKRGKELTYIEKENFIKFLKENFIPEFFEHIGYDPKIENAPYIWDELCHELEYAECKKEILERYSLYLKPEVREKHLIERAVELDREEFFKRVAEELVKKYGTSKLSELYKKDKLLRTEEKCEYREVYRVNDYRAYDLECTEEKVEEIIDWNNLFITKDHILYSYIKAKYDCVDLYEADLTEFRAQLVDSEREIETFTVQFAQAQGFKPATIPMIHLRAPKPYLWIVTLKDTFLDDKLLVCEYSKQIAPVKYDEYMEIVETTVLYPITHKRDHVIGVLAWIVDPRKGVLPGYYALVY
jgi:hypothetical protein